MRSEPGPPQRWCRLKQVVQQFEAKPNKMFTQDQHALVRFLRFTVAVPCAECGKRRKFHWTQLCSFQALSMGMLIPKRSGRVHLPLTPVCRDHLLASETEECDPPAKEKP